MSDKLQHDGLAFIELCRKDLTQRTTTDGLPWMAMISALIEITNQGTKWRHGEPKNNIRRPDGTKTKTQEQKRSVREALACHYIGGEGTCDTGRGYTGREYTFCWMSCWSVQKKTRRVVVALNNYQIESRVLKKKKAMPSGPPNNIQDFYSLISNLPLFYSLFPPSTLITLTFYMPLVTRPGLGRVQTL